MNTRRALVGFVLVLAACATPAPIDNETITVQRADLRALIVTLLEERNARIALERELATVRAKSGCI